MHVTVVPLSHHVVSAISTACVLSMSSTHAIRLHESLLCDAFEAFKLETLIICELSLTQNCANRVRSFGQHSQLHGDKISG